MNTFLCTRPTLAVVLQQNGMKSQTVTSPWDSKRKAWVFQITPELVSITKKFYNDIDRPLPYALRNLTPEERQ